MSFESFSWLKAEFVENVLRTSENDESIEVQNLAMKLATAIGDNYLSDIIRASVEYLHEECGRKMTVHKSLIIKVSPTEEGVAKDMVSQLRAFEMEMQMMKYTLKKMDELLNDEDTRFGPRLFYGKIGDPSVIVMEDLAVLGYRMFDRQTGLDLEHSMLTMRRIAKFHATSVALYEKNPEAMSTYTNGDSQISIEAVKKFFVQELKAFANSLSGWSELGSSARSYSDKFFKLAEVYDKKGLRNDEPGAEDCFKVLNHGDCWTNNMLYRYNNQNKVIDHIFVDFQSCSWTSPIRDIIEFLNTSLSEDVDAHNHELLVEEYHGALTKAMNELGCSAQPPTITAFKELLEKNQILAVVPSCVTMATILIDKSDARTVNETMQQNDGYVNPVYQTSVFRKRIIRRLSSWNARGILDV